MTNFNPNHLLSAFETQKHLTTQNPLARVNNTTSAHLDNANSQFTLIIYH